MNTKRFPAPDGRGIFTISQSGEFEYMNPVYQMAQINKQPSIETMKDILYMQGFTDDYLMHKVSSKIAYVDWQKRFQMAIKTELPEPLTALFELHRKKDQINALDGFCLRSDDFINFIIQAGDSHGYKWSRYIGWYKPKDLEKKKFPAFIYRMDNGAITHHGSTDLSENQMKLALAEERMTIADFLDKGDSWHCLFRTKKGLFGNEEPHKNWPHWHYLSNAWGIPRKEAVEKLKSYRYSIKSIHLPFERNYRIDKSEAPEEAIQIEEKP